MSYPEYDNLNKQMVEKDPLFIKAIGKLPCLACGIEGRTEAHHVKTRGSGGGDDAWNVIPLCALHHQRWHQVGWIAFCRSYPHVFQHLHRLGWQVRDSRLRHPGYDHK